MHSHTKSSTLVLVVVLTTLLAAAAVLVTAPTARADLDTVHWLNYGTVSSSAAFNRGTATVLADQNGHFYVFYYTTNALTGATNINMTKYTTGGFLGLPQSRGDRQVNDAPTTNLVDHSYPLSATIDHSGNLYVAWTRLPNGPLGSEVYVSKSTDGGQTWQASVPVNTATANHIDVWPFVAAAPSGTIYVAWT